MGGTLQTVVETVLQTSFIIIALYSETCIERKSTGPSLVST